MSEEQARNTTNLFPPPLPGATQQQYDKTLNEKVVRAWVGGSCQEKRPVTQSFRSSESGRPTFS